MLLTHTLPPFLTSDPEISTCVHVSKLWSLLPLPCGTTMWAWPPCAMVWKFPSRTPRWMEGLPHAFQLSQESQSRATYFPAPQNRCALYILSNFIIVKKSNSISRFSIRTWRGSLLLFKRKKWMAMLCKKVERLIPFARHFKWLKWEGLRAWRALGVALLSHSAMITGALYTRAQPERDALMGVVIFSAFE